jgi:hypothetical protein
VRWLSITVRHSVSELGDAATGEAAGVVHEDIESTEVIDDRRDRGGNRVLVGDVRGEDNACRAERLASLAVLRLVPAGYRNPGSNTGQTQRHRQTEPAVPARDECHPPGQ